MMISPETFIEEYKDKSYIELIKVRDELLEEIRRFENKGQDSMGFMISPSPEVRYQCNLLYLGKLCELISEKYNIENI